VAGARAWILDQLDAERSRWMLWLPVLWCNLRIITDIFDNRPPKYTNGIHNPTGQFAPRIYARRGRLGRIGGAHVRL
jgi:hypothetical protein